MTDEPRPATPPTVTWVIGASGLLGSAVVRVLEQHGHRTVVVRVPWDDPQQAVDVLTGTARSLLATAAADGLRWRIAWCAGAGVTGTTRERLDDEVAALRAVLDTVAAAIADGTAAAPDGTVFVASSAGGVYGGSSAPPFTEAHAVQPVSDYGRAKLAGEQLAARFGAGTGVATVVGRITNLYGPGQNLDKPQGLISHLCLAQLRRTAISVYVSLDTIRDYLFVDDCADMIRLALDGAAAATTAADDPVVTKIFASHQQATIGTLLGEFRRVFKRAPRVVLGTSAQAAAQAGDLRVRSTVWTELDRRAMTSLPAGVAATAEDLLRAVQHAD